MAKTATQREWRRPTTENLLFARLESYTVVVVVVVVVTRRMAIANKTCVSGKN